MRKCPTCKTYTFREKCPKCGSDTISSQPPRFSPEDKYGKYRRKMINL